METNLEPIPHDKVTPGWWWTVPKLNGCGEKPKPRQVWSDGVLYEGDHHVKRTKESYYFLARIPSPEDCRMEESDDK